MGALLKDCNGFYVRFRLTFRIRIEHRVDSRDEVRIRVVEEITPQFMQSFTKIPFLKVFV